MTYLIEIISDTTLRVTSVLFVGSTYASDQYVQTITTKPNTMSLPEKYCRSLEELWDEHTILLWKSEQELHHFIAATRKWMRLRIKKLSIILPESTVQKIDNTTAFTPTVLGDILKSQGLRSELDIKKLKSNT